MRRRIAAIVALLIIGAFIGWWFNLPAKLGWHSAGADRITLYGNVDIRQVQLGFRVNGRVLQMNFDEGDSVKPGDLLARLDAKPYEDSVAAASAEVATERATLDKLVAGPREAEIAQARAQVEEREADFENAKLAFDRAFKLRPGQTISESALDNARANRDTAQARVDSARQALQLLEEGTRSEDIAAARAKLAGAEAKLSAAKTSLEDTALKAPDAG